MAYAYGVNTADGTANTTVEKFTFTTESLLELDFKLSTSDLSAKSGIINTNPTDANATYYIGYVTADAYTKDFGGDDQTLLNNAVGTINTNLAMGGTFDAVAKKGAMRSLMSGLTPNTAYYAIAFGIKKHKANTVYNTTPLQKRHSPHQASSDRQLHIQHRYRKHPGNALRRQGHPKQRRHPLLCSHQGRQRDNRQDSRANRRRANRV